jgi:hypothetical protein
MVEDVQAAVRRALSARDVWEALDDLADAPPPGLAVYIADHYRDFGPEQQRYLAWLLGILPVDEAGPVLIALLRIAGTAEHLLGSANQIGVALPADVVLRLLEDRKPRREAVAAAGLALREPVPAHAELVRRLVGLLDDQELGREAAISLGRMKATEHTAAIADRLSTVSEGDHEFFVVALELMGDPAAVPALQQRIRRAPARTVFGLHHALRRFTGRDPLLPLGDDEWVSAAQTAWSTADAEPAGVVEIAVDGPRATFVVRGGTGLIDIDYDPPSPGSSWARWGKSVVIGGERLYRVGSDCGTCETTLGLIGWPARKAADLASTLRDRVAHVSDLTRELIDASAPLLTALRTGHYVMALVDLDLELVTSMRDSWLSRRISRRAGTDRALPAENDTADNDTVHFQLRQPLADEPATYGIIMPTQPFDEPDAGTVEAFRTTIRAGRRPAALVLGWIEDRYVEAEYPERFLVGLVLDGHHKLLAYTSEGQPARALLISRIEDSWGPPNNRTQWLDEVIANLP